MVDKTLFEMRKGGIYDQVGFGFHRYSTDREWIVPHFEKMLYDQALLAKVYTEAYQATKNVLYKTTAEEIITYVLRDMTSEEGGFYSAEDADSEGKEGKFYVWSEQEIKSILGKDADIIVKICGVHSGGNWIDHIHKSPTNTNILYVKKGLQEIADESGVTLNEVYDKLNSTRGPLFEYRNKRIHPFKDDKILTDWNSMMISAMAKASSVFENRDYMLAAEKAMNFILNKLRTPEGKLLHRYREGEAGLNANADDYANLIAALLDLYEATFKNEYLKHAILLNEEFIKHFWDEKEGGFFFTSDEAEKLIMRTKEIYDGAIPSGNSVAMLNLIRLARITGESAHENRVSKIINVFSRNIFSTPSGYTQALIALNFEYGPAYEIVICGENGSEDTKGMIKVLFDKYIPNKILILNSPDDDEIKTIAPFLKDQKKLQNKATAYICVNYSCKVPVNSIVEFEKLLQEL
jgi:uncharacterized protein YyaL (SSP411 family)